MRRASLLCLALIPIALVLGCRRSNSPAPAALPPFVAGEILVRSPDPMGSDPVADLLLAKLHHMFGPELESCCRSNGTILYRFEVRAGQSTEEAIDDARRLDPRIWAQKNFRYVQDGPTPNDQWFSQEWWLDSAKKTDVNAPEAWADTTGDPRVTVAVLDSGVAYAHPDLEKRMWRNESECGGNAVVDDDHNGFIDDCLGLDATQTQWAGTAASPVPAGSPSPIANAHGTAVAGIAAAEGDNEIFITGVAWDARVIACKFFEEPREGGRSIDLAECLHYVRNLKHSGSAKHLVAVNASWGNSELDDEVYCAIKELGEENVLVVAAAGNSKLDLDVDRHYPASYFLPNVVSVAALLEYGEFGNSNKGMRTVHLAAPAPLVSLALGTELEAFGATSAAAPMVTGVMALVAAKRLQLGTSPDEWKTMRNLVVASGQPEEKLADWIISGRRLLASSPPEEAGRRGALTCQNQIVRRRLRPLENVANGGASYLSIQPGQSMLLAALSINCAHPDQPVTVDVVDENGSTIGAPIVLSDSDTDADQVDGDGIFSRVWTPPVDPRIFALHFRYGTEKAPGDRLRVRIDPAAPTPQPTMHCPSLSAPVGG